MIRQYIGARYVTKIYENSLDPSSAEWESGVTYEPLTMVTYLNSSYLSKKEVPGNIGNPSANPIYWVLTGAYNGQILNLQNQINDMNDGSVPGSLQNQINTLENMIDEQYDTFTDVISDVANITDGTVVSTKGFSEIGKATGVYIIHDSSEAYYIACGSKYAELIYTDYIDVEALGCPHSPTDCSTIVQLALALAWHNAPATNISAGYMRGGSIIKFGPYRYKFDTRLTLAADDQSIKFIGCGHNTALVYDGADALFHFSGSPGQWIDNIHFKNLSFEGQGDAIKLERPSFCTFENLLFLNSASSTGVIIEAGVGCNFRNCTFSGMAYGVRISNNSSTTYFNECNFRFVTSVGIAVENSNDVNLTNCILEYNGNGFYFNTSHVSLTGCWIEGNLCSSSNTDLTINDVHASVGTNGVHSEIKYGCSSDHLIMANGIKKYTSASPDGLSFDSTSLPYIKGWVRYTDEAQVDYNDRIFRAKGNVVEIKDIGGNSYGFVTVHSRAGSYFGVYEYIDNTSTTLTKISGSLSDPYISATTGYLYWSTLPDDAVIELKY